MPDIFINFRKPDRSLERDRLYRALVSAYGADAIFKSGGSIPAGADYAEVLTEEARSCKIMLVLIGPDWLTPDDYGYSPSYWDQMEIATALQAGNTVIPVLLGSAVMLPHPDELPTKIAQLGRLQFQRLSDASFDRDTEGFVEQLSKVLPPSLDTSLASEPSAGGTMHTVAIQGSTNKSTIAGGDITKTNKVRIGGNGLAVALLTTTFGRVAGVAVVLASGVGIYAATADGTTTSGSLMSKLQGNWRCHEVAQTIDGSEPGSFLNDFTVAIGNGTVTVGGEDFQKSGSLAHATWQQTGGALIFANSDNPQGLTLFGIPDDFGPFHTTLPDPKAGADSGQIDITGTTSKSQITVVFATVGATKPTIRNGAFLSIGCTRA